MALKNFYIKLHKSTQVYSPGELVSGEIVILLSKTKKYRGIKLRIKGKGRIEWSEYNNNEQRWDKRNSTEEYFRKEVYVAGNPDGEVVLSAGQHVFPFTFPLPKNIPSTFSHDKGKIEYSIKAILCLAWSLDPETTIPLIVNSGINLNRYQCMSIIGRIEEEYHSCLLPCKRIGAVEAEVQIARNAVAVGDAIQVTVDLDHSTGSVRVTDMLLKLTQVVNFRTAAGRHIKTEKELIGASRCIGPFPPRALIEMELRVPPVPCTDLMNSRLITINYFLEHCVEVSGCNSGSEKIHEIIIGRRPPLPITIEFPNASAESLMPLPNGEINSHPPPPIIPRHSIPGGSRPSAPPDAPPPYESVIPRKI